MGLFDKKYCDICGNKIGLLGNRKLEDGNLCKDCAAKLSPWFSERRASTVEDIRGQLEYREANKQSVAMFYTTSSFGSDKKLLLDENNGTFMIAATRNYATENPDVLAFNQVTGCDIDVDEDKDEQKTTDAEGHSVTRSSLTRTRTCRATSVALARPPRARSISLVPALQLHLVRVPQRPRVPVQRFRLVRTPRSLAPASPRLRARPAPQLARPPIRASISLR